MLSRALTVLLVAITLIVAGTASSAYASPRADLIDCGDTDAPMPASPYGDGSFIVRPSTAVTELPDDYDPGAVVDAEDPFRSPDEVSIESVYGTAAQWWTYDTGCTGKFVAGAGTSLANVMFQVSAILPSWSHALLDTVVGESDLFAVLDKPVKAATEAVAAGVWEPWLPVVMLLVAGLVLWRARSGRLGGAVTAVGTALGALVVTSVLIQYPTESVHLVDSGVRNVTGMIATGFSEGKVFPNGTGAASGEEAVVAVDAQMDDIVRSTQYRTWLTGVFGDADSAVAKEYGPRVFRSTHFSWAEYASYRSDPDGAGKMIVEAKQDSFKESADAIKQADPVAYEHFKGEHWAGRTTTALVNLVVVCVPCLFLLLAALIAVAGFVLVRIVVPLAPAAGVIFMFDRTRDIAVSWLKLVVGPLVMGPVCFLIALVLLRFTSAVFEADAVAWVVKLGIIVVLTVIAFRLSGALNMVPGYTRARDGLAAVLTQLVGTAAGTAAGLTSGQGGGVASHDELVGASPRDAATFPGGVWSPSMETRAPSLRATEPLEGFVPYLPPPRAIGAGPSAGKVVAAASLGEVATRRTLPMRPSIGDRGLLEQFEQLPEEKKRKWVPLPGYPTGGTPLEKARFYADGLNDQDLDLPEWQRNVVSGRWWNFAVADQYRATEVTIARYARRRDPVTGRLVVTEEKDKNFFLDGLGDDESGSNKYCQVADLKESTWYRYVDEFHIKYDTGRPHLRVADTPANREAVKRGELRPDEIDRPLQGDKILRIPRQHQPIPEWARKYAEGKGVSIEVTDPHPDAGEIQ
ncbi:MAG: hypothetical protein ACRDS9_00635 [Pseudonocardiaceae bacterium]